LLPGELTPLGVFRGPSRYQKVGAEVPDAG
jgi:hypothetical protein